MIDYTKHFSHAAASMQESALDASLIKAQTQINVNAYMSQAASYSAQASAAETSGMFSAMSNFGAAAALFFI